MRPQNSLPRLAPALAACATAIAFLAGILTVSAAVRIPERKDRAVHDYAGVVLKEDSRGIETLAREVRQKSRVAIVVVTIKSLEDEPIEEAALRWAREWGIGDREDDRGILFLVAVGDRKVRIETGYGVEGYLPDGKTGAILDEEALPYFRRGDYSIGVRRTVERLAALSAEEFGFTIEGKLSSGGPRRVASYGAVLLLILVLMVIVGGGVPTILWWLLLGGRSRKRRRGGKPWYRGGTAGGGFGGFGGRGGLGGGGFGGFGGGSFGGGGASRGW